MMRRARPSPINKRPALSPLPQVPVAGSRLCLYEDGTELTADYFPSVPDNSELLLLTEGQAWQGCKWWGPWRVAGRLAGPWGAEGKGGDGRTTL